MPLLPSTSDGGCEPSRRPLQAHCRRCYLHPAEDEQQEGQQEEAGTAAKMAAQMAATHPVRTGRSCSSLPLPDGSAPAHPQPRSSASLAPGVFFNRATCFGCVCVCVIDRIFVLGAEWGINHDACLSSRRLFHHHIQYTRTWLFQRPILPGITSNEKPRKRRHTHPSGFEFTPCVCCCFFFPLSVLSL